jgi:hypothetical protein
MLMLVTANWQSEALETVQGSYSSPVFGYAKINYVFLVSVRRLITLKVPHRLLSKQKY